MAFIDSVYIKDKNYDPSVFLRKYKHVVRKKKISYFITDNIEIYSNDFDGPADFDEITKMKKIKSINLFLKETRII